MTISPEYFIIKSLSKSLVLQRSQNSINNGISPCYLHFEIQDNQSIIAPVSIAYNIYSNLKYGTKKDINLIINKQIYVENSCTTSKLFSNLLQNTCTNLYKAKVKDNIYLGAPGIILKDDNTPLLLLMLNWGINDDKSVLINRVECHISKEVFLMPDNIVKKAILKKILPFCSNHIITNSDYYGNVFITSPSHCIINNSIDKTIKVVIDDLSRYTRTPVLPAPSLMDEQRIHNFIQDNIEEIMYDPK